MHYRIILLATALSMSGAVAQAATGQAEDCLAAAADAEKQYSIPSGLLAAIGEVESGRRTVLSHRAAPWPWTIDADGTGMFLSNLPTAVKTLHDLEDRGVRMIDVGCFQVDLTYHPDAFATPEDAFDPVANAEFAARFLASLHQRFGSWPAAVMNYHSASPELGIPYRDRVLALWQGNGPPSPSIALAVWAPAAIVPEVIRLGPTASTLPAIITPITGPAAR
jgi:soluble lytic murein transglycosylase-like protein